MPYLSYEFTGLVPEQPIDTKNTFTVSETQDVSVVLVQWSYLYDNQIPAWLTYQLIATSGGQTTGEIRVDGLYTSKSTTITFNNVAAGTYKMRIYNKGAGLAYGNGHIYYH
ncbi:hypothetical protein L9W92_12915 [Pelotomaculum terephthalicicum JT]|uniref:hypothetical protein n=1 Tax=Pelotomaculum TaxID=191373 RepID=UPI0009CB0429|nr:MULTISPECIES: hypothetical protein [Pelotomaculum]MCG9968936.1 hypothetical protein [Pelotomaculum terephthalicicum JT]OPX86851.1 MAG: hypothetical protein A4E54_01935 [Pelotomaculum sp. PtaB.Bin117]OPY59924.1 MAG: hypothetical protein A4E56_03011 [Pelotomaculum sp. PtaU1.Bin065]